MFEETLGGVGLGLWNLRGYVFVGSCEGGTQRRLFGRQAGTRTDHIYKMYNTEIPKCRRPREKVKWFDIVNDGVTWQVVAGLFGIA